MRERYLTLVDEAEHETVVNRSRFVCAVAPAATEEDAGAFLARVRTEHPAATHHCFAYVVGPDAAVYKSGDDGEPGGTAGLPMLQVLLRRGMCDVAVVVSRYFGGVKLGAGGLARAYGGAVARTLDVARTMARQRLLLAVITVDHGWAGRLEHGLRGVGWIPREVTYGARVTLSLALPAAEADVLRGWLAEATAGSAQLEFVGETYDTA